MMVLTQSNQQFASVYGPVDSWRYGRSLGIDPIGAVSVCSFNCIYCQLGEIEKQTRDRAIFIPTETILEDLRAFAPWSADVITISGSGEPTLALNLGAILENIKSLTGKPALVLTNGTTLPEQTVRKELALADKVALKLDALSPDWLRRINRPVPDVSLPDLLAAMVQFRAEFTGELAVQTMILADWTAEREAEYIRWIEAIAPTEVQLNTPTRPKPIERQLEGRGNHSPDSSLSYPTRKLKCVGPEVLQEFAGKIHLATGISVKYRHR